ncbi:unnamed protein product, partial [Rotaria sp. Silwood1]
MKSKDIQKLVLSKYEKGQDSLEIFHHINGTVSLITIKRWCKMGRETGTIQLYKSPGPPWTIRTKVYPK